jgi:catechol 2,3-dioxygenase-like lactoylglutathione lyase family enzyme
MITSVFPVVCSADVAASREFYVSTFGFRVIFDSGWYVQLEAPDGSRPQLGVVERDHESVPEPHRRDPAGVLVSIEVDDVDAVYARIASSGLEVALSLRDEAFGQRHFMVVEPSGALVDVIKPIPPTGEFVALYAAAGSADR